MFKKILGIAAAAIVSATILTNITTAQEPKPAKIVLYKLSGQYTISVDEALTYMGDCRPTRIDQIDTRDNQVRLTWFPNAKGLGVNTLHDFTAGAGGRRYKEIAPRYIFHIPDHFMAKDCTTTAFPVDGRIVNTFSFGFLDNIGGQYYRNLPHSQYFTAPPKYWTWYWE